MNFSRWQRSIPILAVALAACTNSDGVTDPDAIDPFPAVSIPNDASASRGDAGLRTDAATSGEATDARVVTHPDDSGTPAIVDTGVADANADLDADVPADAALGAADDAAADANVEHAPDAAVDAGVDGGYDAGGLDASLDSDVVGDASATADTSAVRDASASVDAGSIVDAGSLVDAGSTTDTRICSITVTTSAPTGRYSPAYVCAIWVEDSAGKLVRTLAYFADRRATYLSAYTTALGTRMVDGTTSATINADGLPNFDTMHHNLRWNMKNASGVEVADGAYRVVVELTSKNSPGATTAVGLAKSVSAFDGSVADTVSTANFAVTCPAAP